MSHPVSAGLFLQDITEKALGKCCVPMILKVKSKHQTQLEEAEGGKGGGGIWKKKTLT